MAVLDLCCCVGSSLSVGCRLLIAVACLQSTGSRALGFSSCAAGTQ